MNELVDKTKELAHKAEDKAKADLKKIKEHFGKDHNKGPEAKQEDPIHTHVM